METILTPKLIDQSEAEVPTDGLFVVWIDVTCGYAHPGLPSPEWEPNSEPQSLKGALLEAQEARAAQFPAVIVPEGLTPREDGKRANHPDFL